MRTTHVRLALNSGHNHASQDSLLRQFGECRRHEYIDAPQKVVLRDTVVELKLIAWGIVRAALTLRAVGTLGAVASLSLNDIWSGTYFPSTTCNRAVPSRLGWSFCFSVESEGVRYAFHSRFFQNRSASSSLLPDLHQTNEANRRHTYLQKPYLRIYLQ
jgi:hypothetical protein